MLAIAEYATTAGTLWSSLGIRVSCQCIRCAKELLWLHSNSVRFVRRALASPLAELLL